MFQLIKHILLGAAFLVLVNACNKGEEFANQPPETRLSVESIDLKGEDRLNSLVEIKWWGTDPDGYVVGYEFSFDEINWFRTDNQDSLFRFTITEGSDTIDIDFWVRAIDNDDASDESPAFLKIPLKNTPPVVTFNEDLNPTDTVFNLLTCAWQASDLDGFSSIKTIELKLNDGAWLPFAPRIAEEGIEIASIIPKTLGLSGVQDAEVLDESGEVIGEIQGLNVGGINDLYIRAIDLAGSLSLEDTLAQFIFNGKSEDLLVIGTSSDNPSSFYHTNLQATDIQYDFIDMVRNDRAHLPKIWNPYFNLLLTQYARVLIYCKDDVVLNQQTNQEDIFLEFAAGSIESYVNSGGKIWVVSSLPNLHSPTSALYGILPMDSLSSSPPPSQARLPTDSMAIGNLGYPDLISGALITIDPFYPSSDAEVIYEAQLTKSLGWYGPEDGCVGAQRKVNGNTALVFISVDLHKLNGDANAVEALFEKILIEEF